MKCTHLDALLDIVGIERVSQTAESVFSFVHRPVLGVAHSIVPRCMEPDCPRPLSGNIFVCVHCVYHACSASFSGVSHVERHRADKGHDIYLSVEHGRMYCASCKDFVFHPFLDSAIELQKRISLGARRNFFTSASPLDDSTGALIMDPNESLRRVRSKRRRLMATQHWAPTKYELSVLNKHSMPPAQGRIDPLPPFGLYNLGNSCYMNSVLQAFLNAPPLRCYFLSDDHRPNCTYTPKSKCLACAMDKMICDAYSGYRLPPKSSGDTTGNTSDAKTESPFLVPQRVFEIIWRNADHLATYAQHDAHEFLIAALNVLNTHCRRSTSNAPSPVKPKLLTSTRKRHLTSDPASPVANVRGGVDGSFTEKLDAPTTQSSSIVKTLFSGTLQSDVICRVCGNWSPTLEKFYDVSLDVDKMPRPPQPTRRSRASSPAIGAVADSLNASRTSRGSKSEERRAGGKPASFVDPSKTAAGDMQGANTLFECLSRFTEPEMLGASSKMFCRACGKREEAMKQMSIRSLPSIVSFHFKRFEQSFARIRRSEMVKIDTPVEFPVDGLDLSPFQTSAILRKRKMVPSSGINADADGTETAQVTVPPYSTIPSSKSILRPTSDALYDLFAVVNHNGTIDSGHYTTLVRRNGDWYRCDDEKVCRVPPITGKSLRSKEAYLVFYVQRNPNLQY